MSSFERIGRLVINVKVPHRPGILLSVHNSKLGAFYNVMFDTGVEVLDETQISFLEEEDDDE